VVIGIILMVKVGHSIIARESVNHMSLGEKIVVIGYFSMV